MRLSPKVTPANSTLYELPNGGSAIVDDVGRMLAYLKDGNSFLLVPPEKQWSGNWDWIHRKFSK